MRTVELLLDAGLDAAVRDQWRRLHAAGLRSLATHTHPTNRPHLTLAVAESVDGLPVLPLPVPLLLGPARSLGRALVRAADSPELRALQARVSAALAPNPWHAPEAWTPHVSLALNMPVDQHERALELLAGLEPLAGTCVAARSYDTETRTVTEYV
ncbi:2'-5' RNA ligase family protein [Actinoplanes sp. DH11]|uniref:2'-5' RNA ligase family protein n=1 Tax=Actinoplanes sp. DH11 TaxID=2857011 RepID=UPI001E38935C|nr:2'-5' RNA ligase family protein [Actinoplanes sp. DH11]